MQDLTPTPFVEDYLSVVEIVTPEPIPPTARDSNDDHVLGRGLAAMRR